LWRACQGERVCEHPCLRDREHRHCWLRLSSRQRSGCSNCSKRCGMVQGDGTMHFWRRCTVPGLVPSCLSRAYALPSVDAGFSSGVVSCRIAYIIVAQFWRRPWSLHR
jgi:hypothetical protein